MFTTRRLIIATALAGLALTGVAAAGSPATNIHLRKTTYGQFTALRLQNGNGYPIYMFTLDQRNKSHCTGDCLSTYIPVTTHARVRAWNGVRQKLLGLVSRGHGMWQVTYNHHLLYTSGDDLPGDATSDGQCVKVGKVSGYFYVLGKAGNPDQRLQIACSY